ncbi:MAG: AAA domain-containing protein [Sphingomonas sp.]
MLLDGAPANGRTAKVYKAVSTRDGTFVAIKALTASIDQPQFLEEAFIRETMALKELLHPNIVKMIGSGLSSEGIRYIILEWMDSDLIKHKHTLGQFEWRKFWTELGRPLTNAVAHAHSRDISHRDIAPRNILFGADNVARVADFGIAKLQRFMRSEQTLRQFVSPPFTPPETDDGSSVRSRDVFSLASLFCWCASPVDLLTYEDVERFASTADVFEPAIRDLLCLALSKDPEDRPSTAEEFGEQLERLSPVAPDSPALTCQLALAHNAVERIARSFELDDRGATEQAILEDLNAICGIKPKPGPSGLVLTDPTANLTLLGLTHSYHAKVDERSMDRLVILNSRMTPTGLLERQRDSALVPRIEFRFSSRGLPADQRAVADIQMMVGDYAQMLADEELNEESRLFSAWSRILQARQDVEASREKPVRYGEFQADGRRVVFNLIGTVPQDVVQEDRQIRLQDGSFLTGYIESLAEGTASFVVKGGDINLLRPHGDITVNVYAASEALRRQQRALDNFRQRDVVRPHLADVLLDPLRVAPLVPVEPENFFQDSLDADKKEAVEAALGSEDIMLLRGPPGTGKTTFIAELILQTLRNNPDARILLASQTNVAIDNAIERVVELRPRASAAFEVVRLGTNEERISDSVDDLRLSRRLQAWTVEVTKRVEEYAEGRAAAEGIERKTVLIGMLLEKLLRYQIDALQIDAHLTIEQEALEIVLQRAGTTRATDSRLDLDVAGSVNARRLEIARLIESRRKLVELQNQTRRELGEHGEAEMAGLEGSDLRAAVELYLDGSDAIERIRPILELGAEWTARFGRQDHFEAPFLSMANVVAGTCLGVVGPRSAGEMEFDLCIIDEASKATATEILVPLSRAKRWVLVGDSKQLPPFQDDALRNPEILERYDLRPEEVAESLFGYLERRLPASNVLSLRTQRRMIQPISDLIAGCFYPGAGLECARGAPDIRFPPVLSSAVTWLDTSGLANRQHTQVKGTNGCFNRLECQLIGAKLNALNKQFARRDKDRKKPRVRIAVITGYADQRAKLESTINPRSPRWTHIDILLNTVDAFQGRQADMVIYSVTRSQPGGRLGFLKEAPRLNVALSRGRDALLIVGDRQFCLGIDGDNPFRGVIRWIDRSDGCITEMAS